MRLQLIPSEKEKRRKFTSPQELQVFKEWEANGIRIKVDQKYHIHTQTLYRLNKALELRKASPSPRS